MNNCPANDEALASTVHRGPPSMDTLCVPSANGADLLGIADQTGTLAAGKSADIVAVAGNPLSNMQTTEHPLLVMKAGTVYVGARR